MQAFLDANFPGQFGNGAQRVHCVVLPAFGRGEPAPFAEPPECVNEQPACAMWPVISDLNAESALGLARPHSGLEKPVGEREAAKRHWSEGGGALVLSCR